MKARRLLKMGVPEIASRVRREVRKWRDCREADRAAKKETHPNRNGSDARRLEVNLDKSVRVFRNRFTESGIDWFFEGALSDEGPALLSERMPWARERILSIADDVCRGKFDLLGYHGLSFGAPSGFAGGEGVESALTVRSRAVGAFEDEAHDSPHGLTQRTSAPQAPKIDWHLDPLSARRSPLIHWSRIDPLDPTIVGDSKVIWELNRHQWLVQLGQAYRLTGNERYAEAFARQLQDWISANPPGIGINWASSLETAFRLISWCWAIHLFRKSKALTPEWLGVMLKMIWTHAAHVEKYLSYYFSPNTHLTGEALGLYYAGIVLSGFPSAKRWRLLGARILEEEIVRQVLPDGVYFEQSTAYQRYTVEIYLQYLILAERKGSDVSVTVRERVKGMIDFLLSVRHPDGSMPQIGDADGGWLLPLVPRAPDDFRGVFSVAAVYFGRSDFAWAAGRLAPEAIWLFGAAALKTDGEVDSPPPTREPSRLFSEGGYALMRSGWGPGDHAMIFDVGPLGCPVSGGHGHADLLGLQCSVYGQPMIVDPGTYGYSVETDWRAYFRGTAAHSTVMVDGKGQASQAGPFHWRARPRARLRRWISTAAIDFADADHDGYRRLSDPVVHRRRVLFVKPRYWVVVDDIEGAAEHRVDLRFQFAPIPVTVDASLWGRIQGFEGRGMFIRPFSTAPLKGSVHTGETRPIHGWISRDYGKREPAPALVYSALARLPLRIVTVLFPMENILLPPPQVFTLIDDGPHLSGIGFGNGEERVMIREWGMVHLQG